MADKESFNEYDDELDESKLKEQLKVAKDHVEFLKNEHADMLKSLHEEIDRLHHKCRDLQFRCEAEGCILPDNDFFKCSTRTLEAKVNNLVKENVDLKRKLAESHQAIDILDQKEKLALWQHHQEVEQRDAMILRLEKELETKCSTIAQMTSSQGARRKKSNFWRRFSFSTSNHPSTSSSVPHSKFQQTRIDHMSKEDLPSEIQNSLPSYESQYQSCSSYSSLSDKSVSDDEGFGQRSISDQQQEYGSDLRDKKLTVKLPPISNSPLVSSRQLVRHQIRIHSLANKVTSDTLAIDQIPSPEVAVKRLTVWLLKHAGDCSLQHVSTALSQLNQKENISINFKNPMKIAEFHNLTYAKTREAIEILKNNECCNTMEHAFIDNEWQRILKIGTSRRRRAVNSNDSTCAVVDAHIRKD